MAIFSSTLRTHSREEITHLFPELKLCSIHGRKPKVFKSIAGKRRETFYTATCDHDDCSKISTESVGIVVNAWNKYN